MTQILIEDVKSAEAAMIAARDRVGACGVALKAARAKTATALAVWQQNGRTAESVARDYIAGAVEHRRQLAAGEIEPPQRHGVGRSVVDRVAAASGGSVDAAYGPAFRRGNTTRRGTRVVPSQRG